MQSFVGEAAYIDFYAGLPIPRARTCKLLRNPGIDSKESIPPA